jgi:hypothetical protein
MSKAETGVEVWSKLPLPFRFENQTFLAIEKVFVLAGAGRTDEVNLPRG